MVGKLPLEGIVRPYFDASPDAPLSVFEAEADQHPVFLLKNAGT